MKDSLGAVQSVVVLGGASEIGLAIAGRLARSRRPEVVLAGRNIEEMATHFDELRAEGARDVKVLEFDATATDDHAGFMSRLVELVDDIDVAVLAFGLLGDQDGTETVIDGAVEVARTNYVGALSIALHLATRMRAQGHGSIVVLSSVAGERVRRSNFVYGSSKAGIDGFAQGLSDALEGTGVKVLIVRPGFVKTKMTAGMKAAPMATTPGKVADAVVAGLISGARIVWVPAPLRLVMMILRHLPGRVFRRLPV